MNPCILVFGTACVRVLPAPFREHATKAALSQLIIGCKFGFFNLLRLISSGTYKTAAAAVAAPSEAASVIEVPPASGQPGLVVLAGSCISPPIWRRLHAAQAPRLCDAHLLP